EEIRRERRGFMNSYDSWAKGRRTLLKTATTDPLTQLPNRLHGEDFLSMEWTSARHSGRPLACLMLDLDHFKRINDRYGHGVGDEVLCQVVEIILGSLRSEDLAFRYGGEEFVVICPGANLHTALQVGERIRHTVQDAAFPQIGHTVTLSIGVSVAKDSHHGYKDLLRDADEALYRSKQKGRNRVEA
ncbi:MAG TPA: GGDEF domain-containing protein, partial [Burkholderiales bacterium]|nr:GGDEF domain-containing protein [Burkholderiales bacterium]